MSVVGAEAPGESTKLVLQREAHPKNMAIIIFVHWSETIQGCISPIGRVRVCMGGVEILARKAT